MKRDLPLRWAKPSTQRFVEEAQQAPDYSLFDLLHGYVCARWPYLYVGMGTGQHRLARFLRPVVGWLAALFPSGPAGSSSTTFADTYHGKVVPLDAARHLVTVEEQVRLTDLEQIIPYTRARDIVLKNPQHLVVLECPCRTVGDNPCLPLDVCRIVGEPFAGFVVEHHPRRARWITPAEAVDVLQAEDERGHVHHAFFKDAMLNRFYAICNCCSCCCGAMQAHRSGTPMLASSGYVCRVDADRCEGCERCVSSCQFDALDLRDGTMVVNAGRCMGCGVCVSKCPTEALSLERDPARHSPLVIRDLLAQV